MRYSENDTAKRPLKATEWLVLLATSLVLVLGVLVAAEFTLRAIYGPVRISMEKKDGANVYSVHREFTWCQKCPPDHGTSTLLPPRQPSEFRVAILGESNVAGWPASDGLNPVRMLDALLKEAGHVKPTLVNLGMGGALTSDLELILSDFEENDLDAFVFYFNCNDQSWHRYFTRSTYNRSEFLRRVSFTLLHHSRLAYWILERTTQFVEKTKIFEPRKFFDSLQGQASYLQQMRYFEGAAERMVDQASERARHVTIVEFIENENYVRQNGGATLSEKHLAADKAYDSGDYEAALKLYSDILQNESGFFSHNTAWVRWANVRLWKIARSRANVDFIFIRKSLRQLAKGNATGDDTHWDASHLNPLGQYHMLTRLLAHWREKRIVDLPAQVPPFEDFWKKHASEIGFEKSMRIINPDANPDSAKLHKLIERFLVR